MASKRMAEYNEFIKERKRVAALREAGTPLETMVKIIKPREFERLPNYQKAVILKDTQDYKRNVLRKHRGRGKLIGEDLNNPLGDLSNPNNIFVDKELVAEVAAEIYNMKNRSVHEEVAIDPPRYERNYSTGTSQIYMPEHRLATEFYTDKWAMYRINEDLREQEISKKKRDKKNDMKAAEKYKDDLDFLTEYIKPKIDVPSFITPPKIFKATVDPYPVMFNDVEDLDVFAEECHSSSCPTERDEGDYDSEIYKMLNLKKRSSRVTMKDILEEINAPTIYERLSNKIAERERLNKEIEQIEEERRKKGLSIFLDIKHKANILGKLFKHN